MSKFLMFISFVFIWLGIFSIADRIKKTLKEKPMFSMREDIDEDREY
jgi:hypothetical protein